ncbi:MAG: dihydropteroate synthase [Rhodoglobus sp.]|uniref:dihydropteroate synthase n=1 Tax=Salinibacterium sp. G-O1 TaxID=3046208 RepID=UPI0024BB6F71|nr:dihydropteroate synthase [Salinibacterium sp. G-O1]MDJ0333901.1 dihydropteroate synthase [Salinibacterium sp. G-O1]
MTPTRPKVFGILNVTPDSFSDGGQYSDLAEAIGHGIELHERGADVVDVGGESTRPGASRVELEHEQERVLPVIRGLVAAGVPVSVDTLNADTALAAAAAGASIINDVSGGLADPFMHRVVAETGLQYIAMHWRSPDAGAGAIDEYDDLVSEVRAELGLRLESLTAAGADLANVIIDPGLGFAKTAEHNWRLLAALPALESLGCKVLIGASRKRFLGSLLADDATPAARDLPTAVVSALAADAGVWGVRVHDVASTVAAFGVWSAWQTGRDS